MQETKL